MKSPLTVIGRELRRFGWTIRWTLFHRQVVEQAHQTLVTWKEETGEEETGHLTKSGTPAKIWLRPAWGS